MGEPYFLKSTNQAGSIHKKELARGLAVSRRPPLWILSLTSAQSELNRGCVMMVLSPSPQILARFLQTTYSHLHVGHYLVP